MTEPRVSSSEDGSPQGSMHASNTRSRSKELLVPRLLVSLVSLTLVGLGIMSIATQSYYGSSSKLGGAVVSLSGGRAVAMGLATVFLGLLPLALWFPRKRPALFWALACACAAAVSFCATYTAKP